MKLGKRTYPKLLLRRLFLTTATVLLVAAVCAVVYLRQDRRSICLSHVEIQTMGFDSYAWADDQHFFYSAFPGNRPQSFVRLYSSQEHADVSGKRFSVPGANLRLLSASPSGRYLIWSTVAVGYSVTVRSCFLTDLHHPLSIPMLVNPEPSTFLGEDSFYQCVGNTSGSGELVHLNLRAVKPGYSLTGIRLTADAEAVGAVGTRQLLLLTVSSTRDQCTVSTVNVGPKIVGIDEHSNIPLPEGTELIRAEFSNNGKLALLLRAIPGQSRSWIADLLLRSHIGTTSPRLSIAVCDTEGRDMRVVTHLDGHSDDSDDSIIAAVQMHWLPSGQDLSFMDKQALWLLPVTR